MSERLIAGLIALVVLSTTGFATDQPCIPKSKSCPKGKAEAILIPGSISVGGSAGPAVVYGSASYTFGTTGIKVCVPKPKTIPYCPK